MRMTLTDSLSQSRHPTLTLLIPRVTHGAVHIARSAVGSHLPALAHVCKHAHGYSHKHECCACTHSEAGPAGCSSSPGAEAWMQQQSRRKIRSPDPFIFNGTTRHQKGSEARQSDRREVFSLSHSPGHLVLLTFCLGNTKRDWLPKPILSGLCAPQVEAWYLWPRWIAEQFAVRACVWAGNTDGLSFPSAPAVSWSSPVHHLVSHQIKSISRWSWPCACCLPFIHVPLITSAPRQAQLCITKHWRVQYSTMGK